MSSEGRINKLVYILPDNANKYAEDNSRIKIFLKKEGGKAVLKINNLGEPIDEKDIPHIFDRFIRADKARMGGKNRYGLGLTIAQEIVAAHSWKISISSSCERGPTFTVTFSTA